MAKPVDEEAHFRIDELERRFTSVPDVQGIAGIAGGAASVLLDQLDRKMDAKIATALEGVIQSNAELKGCIKELIECLGKPTTREISAQLPSGPVTMRVSETRN